MPDFAKAATMMVERVRIMKAFGLGKGKMKRPVQNCRARELVFFLVFLGDRQIVSYHTYNLLVIALICLLSF